MADNHACKRFEPNIPVKTIPALPTGKAVSIVSRDSGIK
jgi:hypothetical protein